jgi:hypothetical protein
VSAEISTTVVGSTAHAGIGSAPNPPMVNYGDADRPTFCDCTDHPRQKPHE